MTARKLTGALLLTVVLSPAVHAAAVFYDSASAFGAATAGGAMFLEDFEGISPSFSSTSYDGAVNISSNVEMIDQQDSELFCAGASTSDCLRFVTPSGGSSQTFTFDVGAVNAFGLFIGDLATAGGSTLSLTTSGGATMSWTFPDQPGANEKFFGVVDLMSSFVSATLTISDPGDIVYLDDVQWGTVTVSAPEPATALILAGGLLVAARRRRA